MNAESLRGLVTAFFVGRAGSLGLDGDSLEVEYVLNPGGFVNYSYRVRDGRTAYHVKLSPAAEGQEELRRWHGVAPLLEPYHAPPVLDWIDVGPAAGLLFPAVAGAPPALDATVIAELVPLLARLNADRHLASALTAPRARTAHEDYLASLHRRFTADLRDLRESRPPFIDEDLLDRLGEEARTLERLVGSCAAFSEPLTKPVHGDLWLENILWKDSGSWHLVDWDDMRIGDPAADMATLLGPTARDLRPLKLMEHIDDALTSTERERLPLLGRATLLDWVIDPLADWVEARAAPGHEHAVREEKRRIHEHALALYTESYGV